jgi:hypothetical protein
VPTRWDLLLMAGTLFLVAAIDGMVLTSAVNAQNASCSAACKAAYGSCYKSSQDRARCQAQLQRCLEACIRKRH